VTTVHDFAQDWSGVDLEQAPYGDLVYADFSDGSAGTGAVRRIVYSPRCFSSHREGSGKNAFYVCLSYDGNVTSLESPAGAQHLAGEGYAVCSGTDVHGHDRGDVESGLGPPTVAQPKGPNSFPLTIIRVTADGAFELKQTYAYDSAEKDLTITMSLKNRSPSTRPRTRLSRYFDGDLGGDAGDDIYARTADSLFGFEAGGGGLSLTTRSATLAHESIVETGAAWGQGAAPTAAGCDASAEATPTGTGNFVGRITHDFGDVKAGSTKTVLLKLGRL
jgi:hypothetical protein